MSLLYLWVALTSAGLLGMVTVLDKRLASYNMPSLPAFYAGVSVSLLTYGSLAVALTGIPAGAAPGDLLLGVASGLCWGGALALMFWGYKLEEVSRCSAVIHTFPVFVALMGVAFLGETLSIGQWAGIGLVVVGAFLISVWGSRGGVRIRFNRALPILLGASLLTALGIVLGKEALDELPVWLVFGMRNFGMGLVFACLWRPRAWRQLATSLRDWRTALLLFLAEFALAPFAVWLNVAAISLGPVSLVATATATRPLFVFLCSALCSTRLFPLLEEPLELHTLTVKLAAIGMVLAGIAALTLL